MWFRATTKEHTRLVAIAMLRLAAAAVSHSSQPPSGSASGRMMAMMRAKSVAFVAERHVGVCDRVMYLHC